MKKPTIFLIVMLILWICGSTYWYVNKIKLNSTNLEITGASNKDIVPDTLVKTSDNEIIDTTVHTTNVGIEEEEPAPENKISIENKAVFFESGNDEFAIDEELQNYFNELKLFLNQNDLNRINLIGHTDYVGSENENEILGLKRAEFVKKKLVAIGIDANKIQTISKGENDPIDNDKTQEGKKKERRVEIIIN